jgi:hypothetical protein
MQKSFLFRYIASALVLSVLLADGTKAQPTAVNSRVTDIWIVVKSHFDLGYTDQVENVFRRYRAEMMDNALKVIDENRMQPKESRFVWTVPGWPLWAQMLGPRQDSLKRQRIEKAVREGFLVAHALPFSMHTESQDLEDLVRGLVFSSKVSRQYNLPLPIAAKMTDVPSHSWIIPTLLYHAGIKFLHIGVNSACQYPRVPQLFWWEGPDGSRLLCGYAIDYGSSFLPPADWPCRNYLSMIMAGDNHGPPSPDEVIKWRKQYEAKMPGVKIHFGTLDDFAKATLAEQAVLPVVRGDMPDTWIHGLMSMPQATKLARDVRPLEPALQTLDTHLRYWGLAPASVAAPLATAYEQSLLYGEHTWGMNSAYGPRNLFGDTWKQWLSEMEKEPIPADHDYTKLPHDDKRKWLQSYQDHRNYISHTSEIVQTALQNRLSLLGSAVNIKEKSIVVYNALPWKRSSMVEVNGEQFFVADVPANGYKTIPYIKHIIKRVEGNTARIETKHFIAVFDLEKGGIRSLIDKSNGKELADTSGGYVIGQFMHERFSSHEVYDRFFNQYSRLRGGWALNDLGKPGMPDAAQIPYMTVTPANWQMSREQSKEADVVTLTTKDTRGLAKAYTISVSFPKQAAYIDINWAVDTKTADKQPEGGWLCFPFNIQHPVFTLGRLGGPVDPAKDIVPGTNRHLNAVSTGVVISGDNKRMALCPVDAPLVSLDQPGLWRWSMDFIPKRPYVFVNLYNNMWNTNFPLWQDGSWSERVRIWPVSQEASKVEDLITRSWEARLPLMGVVTDGKGGQLPQAQSGLALSRKGVLVTAFGEDQDGNKGTLLRLWEQAGKSGIVKIKLPEALHARKAIAVTLRGERLAIAPVQIKDHAFTIFLKQYTPASFILE